MPRTVKTKTTAVEHPALKAKSIKATVQRLPQEPLDIPIEEAVEKMEVDEKEKQLLKAEMMKPPSARNKNLMLKYGYADHRSIDNYPPKNDKTYAIKVYAPEEPDIPLESRPEPWFVGVQFENGRGDSYEYHFPLYRGPFHDGEATWKLDNHNTFLDSNFDVIDEISDYSLYQAFRDLKDKTPGRDIELEATLSRYGILSLVDAIPQYDFNVRNHGFTVEYKPLKRKAGPPPAEDAGSKHHIDLRLVSLKKVGARINEGTEDPVFAVRESRGPVNIIGLDVGVVIPPKDVVITGIYTPKTLPSNKAARWFVLDKYSPKEKKMGLIMVYGVKSIKGVYPTFTLSQSALDRSFAVLSRETYAKYLKGLKTTAETSTEPPEDTEPPPPPPAESPSQTGSSPRFNKKRGNKA